MQRRWAAVVCVGLVSIGAVALARRTDEPPPPPIGDPRVVQAAYTRWETAYEAAGGDRARVLTLRVSKGLSTERSAAWGQVRLDRVGGRIEAAVVGLDAPAELWLVENRPGASVRPGPEDRFEHVGTLIPAGDLARLDVTLRAGLSPDLVVVTPARRTPAEDVQLVGYTTLFHRLHDREGGAAVARVSAFGARVAEAGNGASGALEDLVAQGRTLFFDETFDGNGRSCGTCHPAENNLTLDPAFIAGLPDDDPLFVAENVRALRRDFEDPALMREFALILENLDGFGDLKRRFVMRGVPHTLALPTSLAPPPFLFDGTTLPPLERTGWSGDGAPLDGTLRDFAVGAVTQHFPLTLAREDGEDFRLPTDEELDALEAFQLSLGRQEELDLPLPLEDAGAAAGQALFLDPAGGKCANCHADASANTGGGNANFNTGVEDLPDLAPNLPRDDGFGAGSGSFNTPTLVEAADTPPFFHNNAVDTIEEAVAFYTSPAFAASPSGDFLGGIDLDATEIAQVAAFLRVLNALENVRAAEDLAGRARAVNGDEGDALLALAGEEIGDGIAVLAAVGLHPDAVALLGQAEDALDVAADETSRGPRHTAIASALAALSGARAAMLDE